MISHIQFFRQDDLSNRVATCCANPRFRSEKRALKSMKETIKTTKALMMSQYAQMTMKVLNSNITSKTLRIPDTALRHSDLSWRGLGSSALEHPSPP